MKVVERFFTVPLDHTKPDGDTIRVFARNVIPKSKAKTPEDEEKLPFGARRYFISPYVSYCGIASRVSARYTFICTPKDL